MLKTLCLLCDETNESKAAEWAKSLQIPLNPASIAEFSQKIIFKEQDLYFEDAEGRKLRIDFDENHLDYKRKHRGKNELLAKALGASKGVRQVLDLSVGMGVDSVFLSQIGFHVTGVERSPALYLLLAEAFKRTQQEILKNYELFWSDSFDFLRTKQSHKSFDAIYFDPMYPHKKKSALPKQEMVIFRELVGSDEDAARVLAEALSWDVQRVVVKRPLSAEPLLPGVKHAFEGKIVRYDMYMR